MRLLARLVVVLRMVIVVNLHLLGLKLLLKYLNGFEVVVLNGICGILRWKQLVVLAWLHRHAHVEILVASVPDRALVKTLQDAVSKRRLVEEAVVDHGRLVLVEDRSVLHLNDLVLEIVDLHLVFLDHLVIHQLTLLQAQRTHRIINHVAHVRRVLHRAR